LSGEEIEWSDEGITKTIAYPLIGMLVEKLKDRSLLRRIFYPISTFT